MFCGNCGSQNPDGATKCAVCGAPLTEEKKDGKSDKGGDILAKVGLSGMDKNKLTGYAVIAAVALVLVILLIVLFSGRSDTSTLKQYVKAAYDMNGKKIVSLTPKVLVDVYADQQDISKKDAKEELIDEMNDTLKDLDKRYSGVDFDEVKSLKVEIRKVEDTYSKKQLRDFNESFEDMYDMKINAKAVKIVEIKVSGKYDGDKFDFKTTVMIVKIGGSWYIMSPDPSNLFRLLAAEVD